MLCIWLVLLRNILRRTALQTSKITVLFAVIRVSSPLEYSVTTVVKFDSNSYIQPDGDLIINRNLYM